MMKNLFFLTLILLFVSCNYNLINKWENYDESEEIKTNATIENKRLQFKRIQSISNDKNQLINGFEREIFNFLENEYDLTKELIHEKSIPEIQQSVIDGKLTYYKLSLFYLTRIYLIEFDKESYLNSIISINKNILREAKNKDKIKNTNIYSLHGIPILLKDNIGFKGLPTTAGAHSLKNNFTDDASIVKQLKDSGALILGKTNLSEWANYFCYGCPNGYSAMGGQTLHPYGRKILDTGGSSSGSGVSTTSNLAAASLGSETSGSILSPSSANSLVGMKPTIGNVSRAGIVPISSTLDTAGPMTKFVIDNILIYNAINDFDPLDDYSVENYDINLKEVVENKLEEYTIGYYKSFYERDSLYKNAIDFLIEEGVKLQAIDAPQIRLEGFAKILDEDMRYDLRSYLFFYGSKNLKVEDISSIIKYNEMDSVERAPYGQGIFKKIIQDTMSINDFEDLKFELMNKGNEFFDIPMNKYNLDAVLSINNYHAGYAAMAHNPCLTVPMKLRENNEPAGLTIIGKSFQEQKLYEIGYFFEKKYKGRTPPKN
ncbi:MAG: amidase [Flavobacteriaceae bacterium]|nr:MAG: amidase [Flavobacteriaceae bacterium]